MRLATWDPTRLLAPKECLHCGRDDVALLCADCLQSLEPVAGRGCRRCANPLVHGDSTNCEWCRRLEVVPAGICSLFAYRQTGKALFKLVKFDGYWRLIQSILQAHLSGFFQTLPFLEYQALIPIPESLRRRRQRHFNPAEEIARQLSASTGLPLWMGLRLRAFRRGQVGLTYEARRKNAKNRFRVKGGFLPASAILVDDVLTTGATLEAATRTLVRAGVTPIAWFTLFRTP